jgi:hypothetical protein
MQAQRGGSAPEPPPGRAGRPSPDPSRYFPHLFAANGTFVLINQEPWMASLDLTNMEREPDT